MAALVFALVYPWLLTVVGPLGLLSSTTLTFLFVTVWFVGWLFSTLVWEWRAGRFGPPAR